MSHKVYVEYEVEVSRILTPEEYAACGVSVSQPAGFSASGIASCMLHDVH